MFFFLISGSQDVAHDLPILEQYNVTHILNLASYVQNKFPEKIIYKDIKINDLPEAPILLTFKQAFEFIEEGIKFHGGNRIPDADPRNEL